MEENFVDRVKITIRSGSGGNGSVSFRREKSIPLGGPNGGNGGNGGNVFLIATSKMHTLMSFKYKQHFFAQSGEAGRGWNQTGASGVDEVIEVPIGTVILDADSGEELADLDKAGRYFCAARGGRGGRGNTVFKTSTFQAPKIAEKGFLGEEHKLTLEIKLLADVGLIGYPNVGKSTLITKISNSRAKIGDFPFTTLIPNLGVVKTKDGDGIIVADIPGLIEGASEGAGLGFYFLRHIERTSLFIHILDISLKERADPVSDYYKIWKELETYNPLMKEKEEIIVLNKIDISIPEIIDEVKEHFVKLGKSVFPISAVTGEGVEALMNRVLERIIVFKKSKRKGVLQENGEVSDDDIWAVDEEEVRLPKIEPIWTNLPARIPIEISVNNEGAYVIGGTEFFELARRLNLKYYDSMQKFMEIIEKSGINKLLMKKGIRNGDTVILLDQEYEFFDYSLVEEGDKDEESDDENENE